jgi:hypothetical protein
MKVPTTRFPKSLRDQNIWYVTEKPEPTHRDCIPFKKRCSPVTLSILRPNNAEDYTDCDTALQTVQDHPHWFDGVGIRFSRPLFVLVFEQCIDAYAKVDKDVRSVMRGLSGYWERAPRQGDVQGVLATSGHIHYRSGFFPWYRATITNEGLCNLSGQYYHGLARDPYETNQQRLASFCYQWLYRLEFDTETKD